MTSRTSVRTIIASFVMAFLIGCDNTGPEQAGVNQGGGEWLVHTIDPDPDNKGPDGVRLANVNKDGRPDIVTGWEEGNQSKIYLNPGHAVIKDPWPSANIMTFDLGDGFAPEDAVAVDVDQDGHFDLVSSSDGGFSDPGRVKSIDVANLDEDDGMEIFLSWERGIIGYLDHGGSPGTVESWRLVDTGIRAEKFDNIHAIDMDGDGDLDGLTTEENSGLGVVWFENPL